MAVNDNLIAIITALEIERKAICATFGLKDSDREYRGTRVYWRGRLPLKGDSYYEIIVAQSPDMANVDAALLTSDAIHHWEPAMLLLVGIAGAASDGSKPDDEALGDVILGSSVYYYERGKEAADGKRAEPYMYPASAALWNRASAVSDWKSRIESRRPDRKRKRPAIHRGVIACGEKVIAEAAVRDEIVAGHRKIRAIEMEGYGFSKAVWESVGQREYLVIKAICDRADRSKNENWQSYAAAAAASFTKHFLSDQPLGPGIREGNSTLLKESTGGHREQLTNLSADVEPAQVRQRSSDEMKIPQPPDLFAVPSYISGHPFVGRRSELNWLDEWVKSSDPLMIIEAIGGTGKSALTWQWIQERARTVRPDLAGVMWYSFYEGGADMSALAAYALAYMTGESLKEFRGRKTSDLARLLIAALRSHPFLLVLDGLERVLIAYNRLDAAQARDDEVLSDIDHRACIKPSDEELLRQLVAVDPSKILITSRLLPTVLINRSGFILPGTQHRRLDGLHPDDALRMMRAMNVRGDEASIKWYLSDNFENHPLIVGIVAGLVRNYIREPGNFDQWAEDPQAGVSLHLSKLDLKQRRTHILEAALNGLELGVRQLLSRIAAVGRAIPFETVEAISPFLTLGDRVDERSKADTEALPKLVAALDELQRRGLLQWDREKNRYDLHPVVRGFAFDGLEQGEREGICNLLVDHFQSKPADKYEEAKTIEDVQQSIDIFRALVQAGRFDDAVWFYRGKFAETLVFSLEVYHETLAMLKPLFVDSYNSPSMMITYEDNQDYLINNVALPLDFLGRHSEAQENFTDVLSLNLESEYLPSACTSLRNLANSYYLAGLIYWSMATSELALELALATGLSNKVAVSVMDLMFICSETGQFERAESAYDVFMELPLPTFREHYRPGDAEARNCLLRFYQGRLSFEELAKAEKIAQTGNRKTIRNLASLRGELSLQQGQADQAIEAFEKIIEMCRTVGMPVSRYEARLALARAINGEHDQARQICDRLRELKEPPHSELTEAYIEIGEQKRAKYHALEGYKWAWGEGPPYSRWWPLERCRAVFLKLGDLEPKLPAFDLNTAEPLLFEDEVRKAIGKEKESKVTIKRSIARLKSEISKWKRS